MIDCYINSLHTFFLYSCSSTLTLNLAILLFENGTLVNVLLVYLIKQILGRFLVVGSWAFAFEKFSFGMQLLYKKNAQAILGALKSIHRETLESCTTIVIRDVLEEKWGALAYGYHHSADTWQKCFELFSPAYSTAA